MSWTQFTMVCQKVMIPQMVTTLDRKTRKTRYRNIMKDFLKPVNIQHPTSIHHHQHPSVSKITIVSQLLFSSSTIIHHLTLHHLPQVPRCATPYVPLLWCGPPARQLHRRNRRNVVVAAPEGRVFLSVYWHYWDFDGIMGHDGIWMGRYR